LFLFVNPKIHFLSVVGIIIHQLRDPKYCFTVRFSFDDVPLFFVLIIAPIACSALFAVLDRLELHNADNKSAASADAAAGCFVVAVESILFSSNTNKNKENSNSRWLQQQLSVPNDEFVQNNCLARPTIIIVIAGPVDDGPVRDSMDESIQNDDKDKDANSIDIKQNKSTGSILHLLHCAWDDPEHVVLHLLAAGSGRGHRDDHLPIHPVAAGHPKIRGRVSPPVLPPPCLLRGI
jgi:hypothetical protein